MLLLPQPEVSPINPLRFSAIFSAIFKNDLNGIQPSLTQVPPIKDFSAIAIFFPFACKAAAVPALPAPIINKSYFCIYNPAAGIVNSCKTFPDNNR